MKKIAFVIFIAFCFALNTVCGKSLCDSPLAKQSSTTSSPPTTQSPPTTNSPPSPIYHQIPVSNDSPRPTKEPIPSACVGNGKNGGCHKNSCWTYCVGSQWCYTTKANRQSHKYIGCKKDSDCNVCLNCGGPCTV